MIDPLTPPSSGSATGPPSFDGVILAGGRSSRMGTDKAFLELPALGRPLICVSRDALAEAGAETVCAIGGDGPRLRALGLDAIADEHPDEGPLGGLISGLRLVEGAGQGRSGHEGGADPAHIVVVLTCDLPAIDAATVRTLIDALLADEGAAAAVAMLEGRRQILTAAYRLRARPALDAAFAAGERSVRRAVASLPVIDVDGIDPERLIDVDRPHDLDRWNR